MARRCGSPATDVAFSSLYSSHGCCSTLSVPLLALTRSVRVCRYSCRLALTAHPPTVKVAEITTSVFGLEALREIDDEVEAAEVAEKAPVNATRQRRRDERGVSAVGSVVTVAPASAIEAPAPAPPPASAEPTSQASENVATVRAAPHPAINWPAPTPEPLPTPEPTAAVKPARTTPVKAPVLPGATPALLAHRTQLGLNSLGALLVPRVGGALGGGAPLASAASVGSGAADTYELVLADINSVPLPSSGEVSRCTLRLALVEFIAPPASADPAAESVSFRGNILTLPVDCRKPVGRSSAGATWEIAARDRTLLLRLPPHDAPRRPVANVHLLVELNATLAALPGGGGESGSHKCVTVAHALLPLAPVLEGMAGGPAAEHGAEPLSLPLRGGNLFQSGPLALPTHAAAVAVPPREPSLLLSLRPAQPDAPEAAAAASLPAELLLPALTAPLLAAVRAVDEAAERDGGESHVALCSFAALSATTDDDVAATQVPSLHTYRYTQAPDELWLLHDLWEGRRAAWRKDNAQAAGAEVPPKATAELPLWRFVEGRGHSCSLA